MDISERGTVYGLGQGEDFYGIWDLRAEGEPVQRYDKTPEGWEAAWARYRELEDRFGRPGWRRPSPGLVILHIVIGLVLGFVGFMIAGMVFASAGRAIDPVPEDAKTALGLAALGAWILALTGWLLFVYLKARPQVRWTTFLALWLGGVALIAGVGIAVLPAA